MGKLQAEEPVLSKLFELISVIYANIAATLLGFKLVAVACVGELVLMFFSSER